jgi:Calcineurin-like phosphoesterase
MVERNRSEAPSTQRFAVVLSDVHIGNGAPTCWYQSSIHERQLTEVLSWILARHSVVREVVLLGDLFDVWTYPPHVRPPSMRDIIAANRSLLGPSGPLAALVRALPGRVRLLLGNHDGSLTRADIETLNRSLGGDPRRGQRIALLDAPWRVVTGASGARTVFTHGHHWCMFNAPDARSRWATIPVGHFVTRAISYQLSRTLRPGETAADRRSSGAPNGFDLLAALSSWNRRDDLAAWLLTYICRHTGMPQAERIVMPDGTSTSAQEAMRVFAGLFTNWVVREGRPLDALRAAAADWRGEDLAWFAQRLALQTGSDLAVMGHTHVPVGGLAVSPANYVNSGYECVARPDAPPKEFTFTQVDLERATAQVLAVTRTGGGYMVTPARAPTIPSVVRRPWLDYSCYARIENRSAVALRLVRTSKEPDSYWVVPPPLQIEPHSRADIWLQDSIGTKGSGGRFTYTDGSRPLEFVLACPTGASRNVVSSPVANYQTRTGSSAWRSGGVDRFGHPVQARLFVEALRPAAVAHELSAPASGAAHPPTVAARILWPALGFPAVIAPRTGSQGTYGVQRSVCVLLLSDRPALSREDAARHLRIVPWKQRARRRIEQGQPGSFSPAELTVRSGATLERPQKDDHADAVAFGGDRYERSVVASLSRAVRSFYARQGLRHLHEIRVSEAASGRLADGQYHVFWNGTTAGGSSDEMRMLVDRFAVPRRRGVTNLPAGFLIDEYRFDYGALHPPYQAADSQRRLTEVLHPVFVRRNAGSLKLAQLTDTHVDVRNDVYEENLRCALSAAGGPPRYGGVPVRFNNWNRSFSALYDDAKRTSDAILLTGDLIDYGRGHVGLVDGGRHRHELGVDAAYHPDRNWFLFYYLLASGSRYTRPVYTILGNHDWRLNPYPPFAPSTPFPEAFVHNHADFTKPALRQILQVAHGPGYDRRYVYTDIGFRTAVRGIGGYLTQDLDIPGSPVYTTTESVYWYMLLINPFLDYAFAHPGDQQALMLDWAEDEEVLNPDDVRGSWEGFGQRAAKSLSPLQRWHVDSFLRSAGQAKLIGIHAPPLGPFPDWTDDDLRRGEKTYKPGENSRMRQPDGKITQVQRHTITAIRPRGAPYGVEAIYGSIARDRDWFIRAIGASASGVRAVLSGHNHRFGLLVAYPATDDRDARLMRSVTVDEIRDARAGMAAVRREAGRVRAFPSPLYVNTTSAGPRGNVFGDRWRGVAPGWALVTLAADGTIKSVSPRQLALPDVPATPSGPRARPLEPAGR